MGGWVKAQKSGQMQRWNLKAAPQGICLQLWLLARPGIANLPISSQKCRYCNLSDRGCWWNLGLSGPSCSYFSLGIQEGKGGLTKTCHSTGRTIWWYHNSLWQMIELLFIVLAGFKCCIGIKSNHNHPFNHCVLLLLPGQEPSFDYFWLKLGVKSDMKVLGVILKASLHIGLLL